MIQRIQSVFLLLVIVSLICLLFFPLWEKVDFTASEVATMDAISLKFEQISDGEERTLITEMKVYFILIPAFLACLVAGYSIFQYKNRLRQIQLGALNSFLIAATLGMMMYYILKAEKMLALQQQGNYLFGFYLPVAALLFNLLANRFIRRDESLVRSADRIR